MFMRIVQQVNGLIMAQYILVSTLVKERLLPSAKQLLASTIQAFQNVANRLLKLVQIVLNIKAWLVSLTIAAQSIKAVLTNVKAKALQLGLQHQIIAHQTSQPAHTAQSQKKDKPAASTKSVQSRSKGSKTAQTRTARQSTADGLKSAAVAKQPRQRAKQASKKGK
jgi:hypothetical protein